MDMLYIYIYTCIYIYRERVAPTMLFIDLKITGSDNEIPRQSAIHKSINVVS